MEYRTIDDLKKAGFEEFRTVEKLKEDLSDIPAVAGVYMVVYQGDGMPEFLENGTRGFFKGKNPNVPVSELESNWVNNTCVVYIGKATTLSKRISQYLRFGNGENIGHWGGRLIWQIKDSKDLQLCWKPVDTNPRENGNMTASVRLPICKIEKFCKNNSGGVHQQPAAIYL